MPLFLLLVTLFALTARQMVTKGSACASGDCICCRFRCYLRFAPGDRCLWTASTQWAVSSSAEYNSEVTGYGYDVEKAKALLKEAGYDNGFELTINFQVGDFFFFFAKSVCQIIQAELQQSGITVTLNQIEVANYAKLSWRMGRHFIPSMGSGKWSVLPGGW